MSIGADKPVLNAGLVRRSGRLLPGCASVPADLQLEETNGVGGWRLLRLTAWRHQWKRPGRSADVENLRIVAGDLQLRPKGQGMQKQTPVRAVVDSLVQRLIDGKTGYRVLRLGTLDGEPGFSNQFINGPWMSRVENVVLRTQHLSRELVVNDAPGVSAVRACHQARQTFSDRRGRWQFLWKWKRHKRLYTVQAVALNAQLLHEPGYLRGAIRHAQARHNSFPCLPAIGAMLKCGREL